MKNLSILFLVITVILTSCNGGNQKSNKSKENQSMFTGAKGEVKIMTLDPGHFHAALVQKE
ncbi:MAG: hypothetical protein HQ471_03700, partial [Flavobacteriales bacterium]|nr:hypothetical protein [Flavobacteriales bacterium]